MLLLQKVQDPFFFNTLRFFSFFFVENASIPAFFISLGAIRSELFNNFLYYMNVLLAGPYVMAKRTPQ